jgi:hypothetical protein
MENKMDWYEENIEEGVRFPVRLLRDNGVNTECSCEHDKTIQCQYINDGHIQHIDSTLFDAGFRNYDIKLYMTREDGHLRSFVDITFKDLGEYKKFLRKKEELVK